MIGKTVTFGKIIVSNDVSYIENSCVPMHGIFQGYFQKSWFYKEQVEHQPVAIVMGPEGETWYVPPTAMQFNKEKDLAVISNEVGITDLLVYRGSINMKPTIKFSDTFLFSQLDIGEAVYMVDEENTPALIIKDNDQYVIQTEHSEYFCNIRDHYKIKSVWAKHNNLAAGGRWDVRSRTL